MRTIKFKGKGRKTGKWFYGNLYVEDSFGRTRICTPERSCLDIDPDTVGQFTGVHDDNGNEIYEGDIVEFTYNRYVVRFIDGRFVCKPLDREMLALTLWHCTNYSNMPCIVVGNIHDNPKLLKQ